MAIRPAAATRESVSVDFPGRSKVDHPQLNAMKIDKSLGLTVIDVCNHRDVPDIVLLVYRTKKSSVSVYMQCFQAQNDRAPSWLPNAWIMQLVASPMRARISSIVKLGMLDSLREIASSDQTPMESS
jgi:hypothetical protein